MRLSTASRTLSGDGGRGRIGHRVKVAGSSYRDRVAVMGSCRHGPTSNATDR